MNKLFLLVLVALGVACTKPTGEDGGYAPCDSVIFVEDGKVKQTINGETFVLGLEGEEYTPLNCN